MLLRFPPLSCLALFLSVFFFAFFKLENGCCVQIRRLVWRAEIAATIKHGIKSCKNTIGKEDRQGRVVKDGMNVTYFKAQRRSEPTAAPAYKAGMSITQCFSSSDVQKSIMELELR